MIDLFESIIKTHTAVIISEYVRHNNLSEAAKGLLSQGLRTPSLGTWQLFSRVLFEELEKDQFQWSISHFPKEFADLDRALNNDKTNVIAVALVLVDVIIINAVVTHIVIIDVVAVAIAVAVVVVVDDDDVVIDVVIIDVALLLFVFVALLLLSSLMLLFAC